uniref:GCK domain-containing protein n=1 Tax=Globisporangium ultimum (strain ATCC 200006 / CBS 805.95 / DAOM BR144) TaxID=431595 RepID=K3XBV4_GLOUD
MASFQHTLRRFLRTSGALPALATAPVLVYASAASARLEAAPETTPAAPVAPDQPLEFVGVFLEKDSAEQLKKRYPAKFQTTEDGTLFLVLKFNPTDKEKDAFAPILGSDAQLKVKGYAEDQTTQAVLVAVTTNNGDPLEFDGGAEHAHITLSSAEGTNGLNAGHSNVLLERLRASEKLSFLLDEQAAEVASEWTGELPEFESKYFPLYNPFPATEVKIARTSVEAEESPLELKGTVCISSKYDPETGACVTGEAKAECGFCKFMKAGPCGKEFSAWEACLDKCKKNGTDFIEHCGAPTLALRDCVDANPEYYHVLNDPPADEE